MGILLLKKHSMSKKILSLFSIIAAISMVVIISCKHDSMPPVIDTTSPDTTACFQGKILPLIQSNCAYSGCHAGSQSPNLTTYENIMKLVKPGDPTGSKLYQLATGNTMPPKPNTLMNLDQVTLIYWWIQQGAANDSCACDTTTTFTAINKIIQVSCAGCHGSVNPGGGISLNSYANISANSAKIQNAITGVTELMPKTGKLQDCEITQITNWISNGKPNNK